MKRVVLAVISVALFAGVANAVPPIDPGSADVWIQTPGGGNLLNLIISETGVIQLWMDYTAPLDGESRLMVGMDAGLQQLPAAPDEDIEVVGFIGHGPWGVGDTFYRYSRGQLDEAPHDGTPDYTGVGNINYYMFIGVADPPYTESTGLLPNGGAFILDEIIIHGVSDTFSTKNRVFFMSGLKAPSWFETTFYEGTKVGTMEYDLLLGTGVNKKNPVYVHVSIPEPGTLALLAFGGLAAIRRRR
jgi:hypothetical protein